MDRALQVQLNIMRNQIQESAIPDDRKQTAHWCLGQLPALYSKFFLTNESRYGDEIVRLVRCVQTELVKGQAASDERQRRPISIPDRLQQFHEKFGLPSLPLKLPGVSSRRSPKLGVSR
jgi:hypothetical protein